MTGSPTGTLQTPRHCCCRVPAAATAIPSHSKGHCDPSGSCGTMTNYRLRLQNRASSWGRCNGSACIRSSSIGMGSNGVGREGSTATLRLVELPGKGRGVVATRKLYPGELLLVCRAGARQPELAGPTAMTHGAATAAAVVGGTASHCSEAALVSELKRLEWGPRQAQILAFLYRGARQSTVPVAHPGSRLAHPATETDDVGGNSSWGGGGLELDLSDLTDPWAGDAAAVPPPQLGPAAVAGAAATHKSGLSVEELAAVVRLNATGLPSDDVLLAQLYGRPNMSFIGLWPAHAMFNHSCAPNAVAVVAGRELHIRCSGPVSAGEEVCITYSGALGLGPLPLRRALLEKNHRFRCTCPRCTAEERVPRELAQLWSDIVMLASQQLQPQLLAAAATLRGSGSANSNSSNPAYGSGGGGGSGAFGSSGSGPPAS
ncbi:hypothetical protein VOLCADRAFT_104571, partial [Volvox carteri f. nagariensis]